MNALSNEGNVLIPVDNVRSLELAYILDQHWTQKRLQVPLILLTPHSKTIHFAKSMLEWFGDTIAQAFAQRREIPFDLRYKRSFILHYTNY